MTRFHAEDEAVHIANCSPYGLGAGALPNLGSCPWCLAETPGRACLGQLLHGRRFDRAIRRCQQSGSGRDKSLHALDKYTDPKAARLKTANRARLEPRS
ncbi:hypothetical protein JJQ59_33860 (plasmid) [Cupriavidus necator]|uniref:Uncharacterized protein n=1 Tax=Cupriavidus necator TaxID=106590 RepID=A0A367PAM3_CUPNE|nr:hypothetical protein JJQ59_33860 [Cupriavidus necator]RCJ04086.1 hypothetical protein DDK22_33755 [Cupriavidus necator]